MRLRRLRRSSWAAWLGVAALVLNALVPVHLAFDMAEAFAPEPHKPAQAANHGLEWRLVATLTGHLAPDGDDDHHHHPDCPVCSAFGALVGLMAADHPVLAVALAVAAAPPAVAVNDWHDDSPAAAYNPRAPPADPSL
jgi:Protein of unknown function (DUF2946)